MPEQLTPQELIEKVYLAHVEVKRIRGDHKRTTEERRIDGDEDEEREKSPYEKLSDLLELTFGWIIVRADSSGADIAYQRQPLSESAEPQDNVAFDELMIIIKKTERSQVRRTTEMPVIKPIEAQPLHKPVKGPFDDDDEPIYTTKAFTPKTYIMREDVIKKDGESYRVLNDLYSTLSQALALLKTRDNTEAEE